MSYSLNLLGGLSRYTMKLSDNEKIVNFAGNIYNQGTINHRKFVFSSKDACKGRILVLKRGNKKNIQNYIMKLNQRDYGNRN